MVNVDGGGDEVVGQPFPTVANSSENSHRSTVTCQEMWDGLGH